VASRHRFRVDDEIRTVTVDENGDQIAVAVDEGEAVLVDVTTSGVPGHFSMIIAGEPVRAYVARAGQTLRVTVDGRTFHLEPASAGGRSRGPVGASDPPGQIRAIAGVVVDVRVKVGDHIEVGQTVVVIEAMKMQNEVQAPLAGTVTAVHAVAGERIEADELVLEYEPDEADEAGD
jgi:pyruvate carboxylase subunit B